MTLAEQIYHYSQLLPEEAARQALAFVEFLAQRSPSTIASLPPRQPGSAQGKLQMMDEDNEHLIDFQEYLE